MQTFARIAKKFEDYTNGIQRSHVYDGEKIDVIDVVNDAFHLFVHKSGSIELYILFAFDSIFLYVSGS
jgi:hypothetical protein